MNTSYSFPCPSSGDSPNSVGGDIKFSSYFGLFYSVLNQCQNFFNSFFFQFGKFAFFSCTTASFSRCIIIIHFLGAQKQMFRVNTVPNIAAMKYTNGNRDGSMMNHPRSAMGWNIFLMILNSAVSSFSFASSPKPASFCFFNMAPVSIKKLLREWVLRFERNAFRFVLHSKSFLLCHAPGVCITRGHFYCNGLVGIKP